MDLTRLEPSSRRAEGGTRASEVTRGSRSSWTTIGVTCTLVLGVIVRFTTVSALWLDEAQTVAIAHLPLAQMPEALRHDGAPPLFYVTLHAWMKVFGTGNFSVRFLPGLFAVAALPLAWLAGRRLGGSRVGWAAVLLLASSPFAVRYADEARMYSLVVLLVLVGYLALDELLKRPESARAALGVGLVTGALLLSHYWSLYLLVVVGTVLVIVARRTPLPAPARQGARRGLAAMVLGSVLFVPWVPSFLYQLRHTGTPWGATGRLRSMVDTVFGFAGGYWDPGLFLGLTMLGLIVLAVAGRAAGDGRIEIDLRTRPGGRHLAIVGFATLAVAVLATVIGRSAFAVRYASVMFPMVLLLAAMGTAVLSERRVRHGVLAVAVILGFWASAPNVFGDRTSADRVATALKAGLQPGDVIAYCPDQLGPSVSRLLPAGLDQLTFPRGTPPGIVDWVDYAAVNAAGQPAQFAQLLLDRAGPSHTVWVVWAPGYRTYKDKCQGILGALDLARRNNTRPVKLPKTFEHPGLIRFPPA